MTAEKGIMAFVFVLFLNVIFFFAQQGMADVNPGGATNILNYEDSLLQQYDKGNYTLGEFESGDLPNPQSQVGVEGNFFTDTFSTIRSWFLDLPGVSQANALVNAVPNFLKMIGLPVEIAYALGVMWHVLSIFIIVLILKS